MLTVPLLHCRAQLTKFMRQNHEVALRIMQGFAIGLGYPEDHFLDEMNLDHPDNLSTMVCPSLPRHHCR